MSYILECAWLVLWQDLQCIFTKHARNNAACSGCWKLLAYNSSLAVITVSCALQKNNGVDNMTPADAADDVYNDVYDDDSSRHSDVNIWDYRVTITVSVFFYILLLLLCYEYNLPTEHTTPCLKKLSKFVFVRTLSNKFDDFWQKDG